MKRLQEIFSDLMTFITDKLNCRVTIIVDFQDGNVRNCKKQVEKKFDFDSMDDETIK